MKNSVSKNRFKKIIHYSTHGKTRRTRKKNTNILRKINPRFIFLQGSLFSSISSKNKRCYDTNIIMRNINNEN